MSDFEQLRQAISGRRLPIAVVDVDALESNIDTLIRVVRDAGKRLRIANKSIRSPALIDIILERGGSTCQGVMSFAVAEAQELVRLGHRDVLVAYPSVQTIDAELLAALNRDGATVSIVVDSDDQIERLADAGRRMTAEIPLVVEVDMSLSWRAVHIGVRRSPLQTAAAVADRAATISATEGVRFHGVMGYEAQVAGVGDDSPAARHLGPIKRLIKRVSRPVVRDRRAAVAEALSARGLAATVFNGGGTGSLGSSCAESTLTEVTAGSGFLCSHLFDLYRSLELAPAALFALQVVRHPGGDIVTCHGGGFVASGEAGRDRLPMPVHPAGLELTRLEGAGEVQTPLRCRGAVPSIGDPVFFRHAKAGELAEHFETYWLVRGDKIVGEAPTYRGLGLRFP